MSRVGKLPIAIPAGVTITVNNGLVVAKGPKGEVSQEINPDITVDIAEGVLTVNRPSDSKMHRALHGLYRALINNMVIGVSQGHSVRQELVGVGYKVSNEGNLVEFVLGYSHKIMLEIPQEIKVTTETLKVHSVSLSHTKEKVFVLLVRYCVERLVNLLLRNKEDRKNGKH
jgi:large subunit ribosomal protein L6